MSMLSLPPRKHRHDPRDQILTHYTTKESQERPSTSRQDQTLLRTGASGVASLQPSLNASAPQSELAGKVLGTPQRGEVRVWQHQHSEVTPQARPPFLDRTGKWQEDRLPGMLVASQAQMLTAPGKYTAQGTLKGSVKVEGPKAIGDVWCFNDCSPVVNTECGHESQAWANRTALTWDQTVQKARTGRHHPDEDIQNSALPEEDLMMATSRDSRHSAVTRSATAVPTVNSLRGNALLGTMTAAPGAQHAVSAREASTTRFWSKQDASTSGFNLSQRDLIRSEESLCTRKAPGSNNCKLIGGQWRYVERPMAGQTLFRDFYGRFDTDRANYYGRSWKYAGQ